MTFQQIVSAINIGIVKQKSRLSYHGFCIGVSDGGEREICRLHNLSKGTDWYIVLPTDSGVTAFDVVRYFTLLGMSSYIPKDLHPCETSLSVYCYEITMHSRE